MYEIDRLKKKARAGESLTAREGLWLVEKVNQLRDALALNQGNLRHEHPLVAQMAHQRADEAHIACNLQVGAKEPTRGNQSWAEWGLNEPPVVSDEPAPVSAPEHGEG